MSSLAGLFISYIPEISPEEREEMRLAAIEAQQRQVEQIEREKHAIFSVLQFERLSRVEGESGGKDFKFTGFSFGLTFNFQLVAWW